MNQTIHYKAKYSTYQSLKNRRKRNKLIPHSKNNIKNECLATVSAESPTYKSIGSSVVRLTNFMLSNSTAKGCCEKKLGVSNSVTLAYISSKKLIDIYFYFWGYENYKGLAIIQDFTAH
jgi:hypothetical protein